MNNLPPFVFGMLFVLGFSAGVSLWRRLKRRLADTKAFAAWYVENHKRPKNG